MNRICSKALACVLLACSLFASGSSRQPSVSAVEPAPELKDLKNLEELRALFNKEKDMPRLILLISPT